MVQKWVRPIKTASLLTINEKQTKKSEEDIFAEIVQNNAETLKHQAEKAARKAAKDRAKLLIICPKSEDFKEMHRPRVGKWCLKKIYQRYIKILNKI